jgi:hypothetical protein
MALLVSQQQRRMGVRNATSTFADATNVGVIYNIGELIRQSLDQIGS